MRTLFAALLLALTPPVSPPTVLEPFRAPSGPYAAGHRGVDFAARPDQEVRSPMPGLVAFRGRVAGKDVITIRDGRRVVSLEPVTSTLPVGAWVAAGQVIGRIGWGGHCAGRCLHLGLRVDGEYRNPLVGRVHLLP